MKHGRYLRIPEGPADMERLWRQAKRLDARALPAWLPPEEASRYRYVGCAPDGDEECRAELAALEAAGLILDGDTAGGRIQIYMGEPDDATWSIGIYVGDGPWRLGCPAGIENPVLTREDVGDVPAAFIADPFMLAANGTWHMFFEVMNWRSGKGEIGLATSADGLAWRYRQIVLSEAFHLSYPYVFEWMGERYMIPESHQAGAIRLYRAVEFPTRWSCVSVLVEGPYLVDASVVRRDGRWWLFTESNPDVKHDTLRLFHAEDLTGPWREHPRSPIVAGDPRVARPAGRVLVLGDRVVRFAQDCGRAYGTAVRAVEIAALTPTTYREQEIDGGPVLGPSGAGWNACGMHHIDAHAMEDGRWIACVDGWTSA